MFVLLASFGMPLGMAGCFNAEAEAGDEAAAVAEALTRSVSFVGGSLEDGPLPDADDDSVSLVPLESSVVLVPGAPNLMSLTPDNPDEADDPIDAVLVQFGAARKHIEVSVGDRLVAGSDEGGSPLALDFDVADDACDTLCNRRFTVQVKQQLKLRSGKKGRAVSRTVDLECSSRGSSKYCTDDRPNTGSTGSLEDRLLSSLERCDLVAKPGNISVDRLPCVWECLAGLDCATLRGALCEGSSEFSTQCASSCTEEVLAEFSCGNGDKISAIQECDGSEDCSDGSDEKSCDSFSCDGTSLPAYVRCDLAMDCTDGSDEEGCVQLSCAGAIDPGAGEGGGAGFGGTAGGAGAMTAGSGGFSGAAGADGADAGPRAGTGGSGGSSGASGGIGGIGGAAGIGGTGGFGGAAGAIAPPGEYGAPCVDDVDCNPTAPHCEPMPSGNVCSMNCTGQCPPLPGDGFVPFCLTGICMGG